MRHILHASLALLALLIAARAAYYLVYVYELLPSPDEVGFLESKLVHLAWRVQAGVRLYPPWRDYPYVTNFYSPCYFLIVGGIARCRGSSLEELFIIGRAVTVFFALATAAELGKILERSDGRVAGLAGATASLGAAPMLGTALMTRPDTMAEFLGISGFFLAIGGSKRARLAGTVLLVMAAMTKQTAVVYLLAAAATLAMSHRVVAAAWLLACGTGLLALIVGLVTFRAEPMFASSLMGEGNMPWDLANWFDQMAELLTNAPDLFVVPALALTPWLAERPRKGVPIVLSTLLLGIGVVTAAKIGSGLNYFLSLRIVEAQAIARLWSRAIRSQPNDLGRRSALVFTAAISLVPGTLLMAQEARLSRAEVLFARSSGGRQALLARQHFLKLAENPHVNLLTDSELLQLHQRERAAFVDSFQFRVLVESGVIRPDRILHELRFESYDMIITKMDFFSPRYATYIFGLPRVLTQVARAHYRRPERQLQFFTYLPRRARRDPERPGAPRVSVPVW